MNEAFRRARVDLQQRFRTRRCGEDELSDEEADNLVQVVLIAVAEMPTEEMRDAIRLYLWPNGDRECDQIIRTLFNAIRER